MKRSMVVTASLLAMVAGGAMARVPGATPQPEIRREGAGDRRAALAKMELQPFKFEMLSGLTDYTNGAALTPESIKGKVLLIATWQAWQPASQTLLSRLQALSAKHGKDGLVVLGVHDARKWDMATTMASEKGAKFLMARDADGSLRKGLMVDADPDLYLVDRAGNLRFADFETDVLERAVELAVGETAESAAAVPKQLADAERAAREAAGRTTAIDGAAGARGKVKPVFAPPSAEQYELALWPKKNEDQQISASASDVQGQKWPGDFTKGEWLSDKPDYLGKVVIVDFWATWCAPCMRSKPLLEDMQHKLKDDLVIIGVSGYGSDEKNKLQVQQFMRHHPDSPLTHIFDTNGEISKAVQVRGLPTCFIISTDGTVRWQGNPLDPSFRKVAEAIIAQDPGVKARRAAEAKAAGTARGGMAQPN